MMGGTSRESCPTLLNLMPSREAKGVGGVQEEKKLELRLGPPGEPNNNNNNNLGDGNNMEVVGLLPERSRLPHPTTTTTTSIPQTQFSLDISSSKDDDDGFKKPHNTSSQKRSAPGPLVGWPPIRSFRKNNITTTTTSNTNTNSPKTSNPPTHDHKKPPACENPTEGTDGKAKGGGSMFVKINMEGVGIGRKVDLMAYGSYDKLSSAADVLFRGLLEGQRDKGGVVGELEPISGGGEYTLVYEDNEGDRMLLGDVPWIMFLSTVKRLRVIKRTSSTSSSSSQLSSLFAGGDRHDNILPSK